ncbi:unnamed protein product [Rotaria sp. Silwood1]|nr:unnamed protein product [Rotaria sp. Silwood1]
MVNFLLLFSYCPSISFNISSTNETIKSIPSLIPCALTQFCTNNNLQTIINLFYTINKYLDDIIRFLIHINHRLHEEFILILKQIVLLINSSYLSTILINVNLQHKLDSIHEQTNLMHENLVTIIQANVQGVDPIKSYYMQKLEEIHLFERSFLNVHCAHIKQLDKIMYHQLLAYSQEVIPIFDIAVNELFFTVYEDDTLPHQIQVQ